MQESQSKPESDTSGPNTNVEIEHPFNGMNRKELRALGHKGGGEKPYVRMAGRKKVKHWLVTEREARIKAALAALDTA